MPSRELTQDLEAQKLLAESLGLTGDVTASEFATRRYQLAVRAARDNALRIAQKEWSNVSVGDIDGSFSPWREMVAGVTAAAVRATVVATSEYLTTLVGETVSAPTKFVSSEAQLARRLERAAIVMKIGVGQRRNDEEVLNLGLNRALQVIRDEVTSVPAQSLDEFNTIDPRVIGWVRVTWGTCDLCARAAGGGNVLPAGDSMHRHPNCQCVAVPVVRSGVGRKALEEKMAKHADRFGTGGKKYAEMQRELDALRLGEPLPPTRPVARPEPKPEPPKTEVPSFDTPVSSTGPTRLFPDTEMPEYDWRALSDKAYKMENPPANAPFNYEYKNPEAKKLKAQADEMEDKYFADKQAFEREVFDTPVPIKYSRYAREGDNYDGLVDGSDLQKARDKYVVDDENTLSLNESLRNGGKPTALVKRIDKWIDSTSIREPITVQRGIVIDRQFALDNYTVGSELTSPAFTSTSVLPGSRGGANARGYLEGRTKDLDFESEAKRLGMTREEYLSSPERSARDKYFEELLGKSGDRPLDNGVIFEIRLETGQKAGWAGQGEVVLPRGTTLRVDSVTEGGPYDPLSVKATVVKKAEKPVAQRVPAQGNSPSVSTEAPIDVLSRAATEVVSGETETAYKQLLDTLFEDTLAHKGMTALPKVVSKSEWDSLPGDSFFRGIKAGGRLSQSELDRAVNDFYEGDCFTGDGILGKGIYATPDLETAQSYAYGLRARPQDLLDPSAHVFDMKFSADTKFIDMAEARALQEQERKAIADNAYRRVAKIVEDKQSGKITAEQYSAASRTERYRAEAELALNQQSLSSWAMSHDYDVLTDYQYPQMVVLNRGKVITHR